jgi:hypothetical protein
MAGKKTNNSPEAIAARRKKLGLDTDAPISVVAPQQLDAEAMKRMEALVKSRKKADTKKRQESTKAGDTTRVPVPFEGFKLFSHTYVSANRVRTMLIPETAKAEGEVTLDAAGQAGESIDVKTKPIKVAYGYKLVKRTVNRKRKGGSATMRKVIAWIQISVPAQATFLDVITWVKGFGKVPALVRMGKRQQRLGKLMANAGAMV